MSFDDLVEAAALRASGLVLGGMQSGGANSVYDKLISDAKRIERDIPPSQEDLKAIRDALLKSAEGFKPSSMSLPNAITQHMKDLIKIYKAAASEKNEKVKSVMMDILDKELDKLSTNDVLYFIYGTARAKDKESAELADKLLGMRIDFKKIEKELKEDMKDASAEEKKGSGRRKKKQQ